FVDNAILGPLADKRVAVLDRISLAIDRRGGTPPADLTDLADCSLSTAGASGNGGVAAPPPRAGEDGGATVPGAPGDTDGVAGSVVCPEVAPLVASGVPEGARVEVDRELAALESQIREAEERLVESVGQGGPNFVDNAILGPLADKRVAVLDRISLAIDRRGGTPPADLTDLADCRLG
ncbi:hypothetical protein, partial [Streptomyces calidiresistens]|uniref:hypothetical protein n=1 Tax=Streptomyces calidiresistens TaxID=1485586 RepID=UPI0015FB04F2